MLKKAFLVSDFLKSFAYALRGLGDALISERNFRILWLCGLLLILINFLIKFELFAQIIFLALIFIILGLELINSALEKSCDSISSGHSLLIKNAKDFSAGAVLLAALGSFLIFGLLVTNNWPLIYEKLKNQTLFFVGIALIAFINFILCLRPSLKPTWLLSLSALFLHVLLVISFSGSLFFLVLSLIFHASLACAFLKQQNIC